MFSGAVNGEMTEFSTHKTCQFNYISSISQLHYRGKKKGSIQLIQED